MSLLNRGAGVPRHKTFFVLIVIGAGVKALVGEGEGSIPVAYAFFYLAVILYGAVGVFGRDVWLARAALGVFGHDVWAGFAAGARGTAE